MCNKQDHLLYVISCRGAIRWQSFKKVFEDLFLVNRKHDKEKILMWNCQRAMADLGYCDFQFDTQQRVYAAPSALCRLPMGSKYRAILTGSRTPQLIEKVMTYDRDNRDLNIEPEDMRTIGVPRSIFVEAKIEQSLRNFSDYLTVPYFDDPPAWKLAQFSGNCLNYEDALRWQPATEPRWETDGYDPCWLKFDGSEDHGDALRMRRERQYGSWQYSLWKKASANLYDRAICERSWGQYLIAKKRKNQLVAYDTRQLLLAVPAAAPLPDLLSRALALCSGAEPIVERSDKLTDDLEGEQRHYRFYTGVPIPIAESVMERIGQAMTHTNIRRN